MSDASFRTFANEQKYRNRRADEMVRNPGFVGVLPDPSWDAFWGSLEANRDAAHEQGLNFRVDTSGLGNGGGMRRPSLAALGRPGDDDVARNWAVNDAIEEDLAAHRARPHVLRGLAANADMIEESARQARAPLEDRAAIDRAFAISRTGQGVLPAEIVKSDDGSYASRGSGPTADPRQVMLGNLPGHLQPVTPPVTFGAPQAAMVGGKRQFVRAGSDGQMYGMDRQPIPADALTPDGDQNEPLVAVMGPKGPVLVPRSKAVGQTPASNREQGRPVSSVDANRIADLDTSLDDLNVLTQELGITGTKSKIGADAPNWFTDLTGWGLSEDAKSRQAVVDRVRQVIGKALEGGVLRKEDEDKYKKILPTIGDPPDVAKSKLEGLWNAIEKRRQTTLDALSDANYDVDKFTARAPRTRGDAPAGGSVSVTDPNGGVHVFPNQAAADAFKKAAGIK